VNITCGRDMPLREIREAVSLVEKESNDDANIIFGAVIDETMQDEVKVTVIATGFDKADVVENIPNLQAYNQQPLVARYSEPQRQPVNAMTADNFETPTFIRKKAD
jgi:cell division protein FtsZ